MSLHLLNVEVAEIAGVNAGLIFHHFTHWIEKNVTNGKHYHDGLYWTYNSMSAFEKQFSYMPPRAVRSAIDKLVSLGLIRKGNFNKSAYDRTTWYAITEKGLEYVDAPHKSEWTLQKGQDDLAGTENRNVKSDDPICQDCQMETAGAPNGNVSLDEPIPDIIPDNIPDKELTDKNTDNTPPTPHGGDGGEKPSKKSRKAEEPVPMAFPENPLLQSALEEWLAYKAEKHQKYASKGLNTLITRIRDHARKYGAEAVITLIQDSMANNWQGIAFERLERPRYGKSGATRPRQYDYSDMTDSF